MNTLLLYIPLLAPTDRRNHRRRNELILVGLGNLWFLQVHTTYVFWSTIKLWCCVSFFSFWQEIVFGVSYIWYLLYSYSCAVVSVFWLWREIVLKMRPCFYKKILLGSFIMIRQPMCVFIRPNTLLLCIFLFCIFLLYRTDLHIEVQIRILLKDK